MTRRSHLSSLRAPRAAANARTLRSAMTDAECKLWYHLRAGRFDGWKFRRQVPLGPYVVDFLCEQAKLVVEVDGGQHTERSIEDETRTRWLNERGYRVIRFWNHDVLGNLNGVWETISAALARI